MPLSTNSLDIAVFSLSLMGTNYIDFIIEANRVLRNKGTLLIAEVLSRFTDINFFTDTLMRKAGFKKVKVQKLNDFFYIMVFQKHKPVQMSQNLKQLSLYGEGPRDQTDAKGVPKQEPSQSIQPTVLKPCLYKKR